MKSRGHLMAKKSTLPRFMGLNSKLVITNLILTTLFSILLSVYFYYSYTNALQRFLLDKKNTHSSQLTTQVSDSAANLQSVITGFSFEAIQNEVNARHSREILKLYKDQLNSHFYGLVKNWGVDKAYLFDSQGNLYHTIKNHLVSSINKAKNSDQSNGNSNSKKNRLDITEKVLTEKSSDSFIICKEVCRQYISLRLNNGNQHIGYFVASQPMAYFSDLLYSATDIYLSLLQPSITSQKLNEGTTLKKSNKEKANSDTDKPSKINETWTMSITQHWQTSTPESIKALTDTYSASDHLNQLNSIEELDNMYYSFTSFPVATSSNESLQYLIVEDITDSRNTIISSKIKDLILIAIFLCLVLIFFNLHLRKYNARIKQQTQIIPLINDKQFHEARELIYHQRHRSYYRDESDTVDDLMTSMTYQFESLHKAVNLRTREMERLSLFDPLTGLANRNLFFYELQSDLDRFTEQDNILATIMIDLDNFKRLNDSLGHQYGDMLLGKIGLRLKNATRNLGMVARLGGDEFAITLRGAKDFALLEKICKKVVALTSRPIELDSHSIVINCSLGVALAAKKQSANDLLKNAEIAMYNAKSRGGNTFSVFSSVMAQEAHDSLTLESDIRRALGQEEFTLYLQPKVTMDNVIQGFEALVRWDHPERGILLPMEFIPAMESMGIINQLDNFVLDASCRQLKSLQAHYPDISIAVNISSMHFTVYWSTKTG
ncbi:MAG: putative bifunctional diguanylate cyclase/phosphodiesterase, partial [Cellvibrionaceae bacterium]